MPACTSPRRPSRSYRKRIIAKLGARNGTHAVALALRKGLLPLPRERELQLVPQRARSARELRR